tara:strand:+ start:137 stop:760 length:624 start_codon:yes stop_codon:yes gene_type:complete
MVVRIDKDHQKIEQDYNLDWHITMVSAIKDEDEKIIKPQRVRITITDKITKMPILIHNRPGRGAQDELLAVHEALDMAKATPKPKTPAQLAQHVSVQDAEIAALKVLLETPDGAQAIDKKCKNLKGKLKQRGMSYPAGLPKDNNLEALRILEAELDKATATDKDEVVEVQAETAPSEGHDQPGPDNRADEASPVAAGQSSESEDKGF